MTSLRANGAFVRLFAGRVVTNAGDSLYAVAATWLVYDLTGSSFYAGVGGALVFAPQALQFLAGPLVDRWPLRRGLVATRPRGSTSRAKPAGPRGVSHGGLGNRRERE